MAVDVAGDGKTPVLLARAPLGAIAVAEVRHTIAHVPDTHVMERGGEGKRTRGEGRGRRGREEVNDTHETVHARVVAETPKRPGESGVARHERWAADVHVIQCKSFQRRPNACVSTSECSEAAVHAHAGTRTE
jgi:hypothetical protein